MKRLFAAAGFSLVFPLIISGCVSLSPAGKQLQVLAEGDKALSSCELLAGVDASSELSLRNQAASHMADTLSFHKEQVVDNTWYVGEAWRCHARASQAPEYSNGDTRTLVPAIESRAVDTRPADSRSSGDYARRGEKCRALGGDWLNHQCIVPID